MKIIDNNGIQYVIDNRIHLTETFFVTSDVKEECEVAHDKLPRNVKPFSDEDWFDGAGYLVNYQEVLNRRHGRSFYNMTGFGDVSIVAALMTLKKSCNGMLPAMIEDHIVITDDDELTRHIKAEFNSATDEFDQKVQIIRPQDYRW
jgi:rRNA-processing protein FCF1